MQDGLDVAQLTEKYKLDEYVWDLDEFELCEKHVDGNYSYMADADIKESYDAI